MYHILITQLLLSFLAFAQNPANPDEFFSPQNQTSPDTLFVEMEMVKGFGGISASSGLTRELDPSNPWYPAVPKVTGIPENLTEYTVLVDQLDFVQHAYQSYHAGLIDSARVFGAFESWGHDTADFTSEYLNTYVAMLIWDEDEETLIKITSSLPLDFSGEEIMTLPEPTGFLNPDDMLVKEISYEMYHEGEIKTVNDWFRISKGPDLSAQGIEGNVYFTGNYSHRRGTVEIDGTEHVILLHNNFSGARFDRTSAGLAIPKEDDTPEQFEFGQFIELGDAYFRFVDVAKDGSYIALEKLTVTDGAEGAQIGFKAFDFATETTDGDPFTLSDLEGSYVFLDFWGTWCAPCIHEMPYLKEAYRLFRGEGFEMVGIAYDDPETLAAFVEEWEIEWPQIVQTPGSNTEINDLYNIRGFPTTYMLDTERIITASGLRMFSIEEKLFEEVGINENVAERIKEGNLLLEIPADNAESVHISGSDFPFGGRIPLYNIEQSWVRGFNLDPGTYTFRLFVDGERASLDIPGKTEDEDGNIVYVVEVPE